MIKSIVQPIPTFVTSCFKLPLELCKDLTGMMNSFWCGQKANERRIHWVGWSKICYYIRSKVECDFRICYHIRSKASAFLTLQKRLLLVMAKVRCNNTKSRSRLVLPTVKSRRRPSEKPCR